MERARKERKKNGDDDRQTVRGGSKFRLHVRLRDAGGFNTTRALVFIRVHVTIFASGL